MDEFTKAEMMLIKKIIVFYMHHHMSMRNPQYEDVNRILGKIKIEDTKS